MTNNQMQISREQIEWLKQNSPEEAAFMAAFFWDLLTREDKQWAAARDCASAAQLLQEEFAEAGRAVPQIVFLSKRDWNPRNERHPEKGVECHFMNAYDSILFDRFGNEVQVEVRPGTIVDFGNGVYKIEEIHSKMSEFEWMSSPQGHHKMAYECHVNF